MCAETIDFSNQTRNFSTDFLDSQTDDQIDAEEPVYSNSRVEQHGDLQRDRNRVFWRLVRTRPFHNGATVEEEIYFLHIEIPSRNALRILRLQSVTDGIPENLEEQLDTVVDELLRHKESEDERLVLKRLDEYCRQQYNKLFGSVFRRGVNSLFIDQFLHDFIDVYDWEGEMRENLTAMVNNLKSALSRYFVEDFHVANQALERYHKVQKEALESGTPVSRQVIDVLADSLPYDQVYMAIDDKEQLFKVYRHIRRKKYLDTYFECLDRLDHQRQYSALFSKVLYKLYLYAR